MAYDGRVYRILIASPSDVEEEREIAVKVIQEWNDLHSYSRKVVLLPLRWETHTAPEYGTRPQEVINRTVVDQCDLLVGIFWTRIGTPTGEAESGTLEEIDRAGKAGKPIMLYFSKVGIDPERLDLDQIRKLNDFKKKTYPNSLTESYKSHLDFRDKFSKQLELKIRDLQKADDTGQPPLLLSFFSLDTGELLGNKTSITIKKPNIKNLNNFVQHEKYEAHKDLIKKFVRYKIRESISVPIVLAIKNVSSLGVSNLYIALYIKTNNGDVKISDTLGAMPLGQTGVTGFWSTTVASWSGQYIESSLEKDVRKKLNDLKERGLAKTDDGWEITFELRVLQPQLTGFLHPHLFITAHESTKVNFAAKIYADNFPQPLKLDAEIEIKVTEHDLELDKFVPDIDSMLKAEEDTTRKEGSYTFKID